MQQTPTYTRLADGDEPPDISEKQSFRAVVVVDMRVTRKWQNYISKWLVYSGCLYMMAWGINCSSWDDSVGFANLCEWLDLDDIPGETPGEIPDDSFVMTTWHENAPLEEVFEFSEYSANHPVVELPNVLLLHIGQQDRQAEFLELYRKTRQGNSVVGKAWCCPLLPFSPWAKLKLFFSLRQIPEVSHLSKDDLKRFSKNIGWRVLWERGTLAGLFAIAAAAGPFGYWAIVKVRAEPLSMILTAIVSVSTGLIMSQYHIHRMRKWLSDHPTEAREWTAGNH